MGRGPLRVVAGLRAEDARERRGDAAAFFNQAAASYAKVGTKTTGNAKTGIRELQTGQSA
jgi:hypothetical protein